MSELKAVHAFDVYEAYTKTGDDDAAQVYLKSEADNVIAEKDAKIIQLEALIENYNRIAREIIDNANHQKHKRCLAMARCCESELYQYPQFGEQSSEERRLQKWLRLWLAIAEKFKEAK